MPELFLSTGRKILYEVNGHADRKQIPFVIHYGSLPTPEEKIEAAEAINNILHPAAQAAQKEGS